MQNTTQKTKSRVYLKKIDDWSSAEKINSAVISVWRRVEADTRNLVKKDDFLAIKLTFGEEQALGYIKSNWISGLVEELKPKTENIFILETNTLYREKRSNAVGHLKIANLHGYGIHATGIPVIIGDGLKGRASQNIAIRGEHFENVKLAREACESDIMICLSHVTGHCQTGFAGAIKNLGMGCAARAGKLLQHSKTLPEVTSEKCSGCGECMGICPANAIGLKQKKAILVKERCIGCGECTVICRTGAIAIKYDENVVKLQEKMVEYALGVKTALSSKIACINFLSSVTKNCDCMSKGEEPVICPDIGVIGGIDPVAVDASTMDTIGKSVFKELYPEIDCEVQLRHAEKLKLGSAQYELIEI